MYNSPILYQLWADYNLWYYLQYFIPSSMWASFYEEKYSPTLGDALLANVCDATKTAGITVYAIGFEAPTEGIAAMENCASSPGHFYDVSGTSIQGAFAAIADQINELRLTN